MVYDNVVGRNFLIERSILNDLRYRAKCYQKIENGPISYTKNVWGKIEYIWGPKTIDFIKDGKNEWIIDGITKYTAVSMGDDKNIVLLKDKTGKQILLPLEHIRPENYGRMDPEDLINYIADHMPCVQCNMKYEKAKLTKVENNIICDNDSTHIYSYFWQNDKPMISFSRNDQKYIFNRLFNKCEIISSTGTIVSSKIKNIKDLERLIKKYDKLVAFS
jgi:hypothetical protein